MPDYKYVPEPEFTPVNNATPNTLGVLHCIAMARDAISRSPLKTEWTRDALGWLDGAVAIVTGKEGDQ